jgi:hypothetical protein
LQSETGAPDSVLVQISESHVGRALRTHTHTYAAKAPTKRPLVGHRSPSADHYVGTHLYDNIRDPHQRHNLINDPASIALRHALSGRLAARIRHVEGNRPTVV